MKFNLSPSSIATYLESPLLFYFQYVIKAPEDTSVVQCYGISGSVTHSALEFYVENRDLEKTKEFFLSEWEKNKLNELKGMNGKPLSIQQYYDCMMWGIKLIDSKFEVKNSELKIEFPFRGEIGIKGIVDLVQVVDGVKEICDWKTSSTIDNDSTKFRTQVLMYSYLYYKKTGEIINNARIVYLKLKKDKIYSFTDSEVINFEKILNDVLDEIELKGLDISKYDLGYGWENNIFNAHKKKFRQEAQRRENIQPGKIIAIRKDNRLYFQNIPDELFNFFQTYFRYHPLNYFRVPEYISGEWDGYKRFFKYDSFPYAFLYKMNELVEAYNKELGTNYFIEIIDERNMNVVNKIFSTKFKETDIKLRPYQNDANKVMEEKKLGIVFAGTSAGKSILSAEFIKKQNRRTLFVVNRLELSTQTKEVFEDYLGVEIGEIAEGQMDITKQITVSCIQTIYAILKRNDESSKILKKYLYNVSCVILDECQNCSGDNLMYSVLSDALSNVEYCLSMSGSPYRNGPDTFEMNSLCGFIIYTKTVKELEDEGWVAPVKTYYLSMPRAKYVTETGHFEADYGSFIVSHDERNETIRDIVKQNRHKKIIILVNRIGHGINLNEMIGNSFFLYGDTPTDLRKEMFKKFKEDNNDMVLISMVKILGAGIDVPRLDLLINASAHSSDVDTIQIIGRLRRKYPGKNFGVMIDFADEELFKEAARKRIRMLMEYEYPIDLIHYTQWKTIQFD